MSKQDSWYFPRTALAASTIKALNSGITSSLTLFAERRMGKTEFLNKDVTPAAEKAGFVVVYINLWSDKDNPATVIASKLYQKLVELDGKNTVLSALHAKVKKLGFKVSQIGVDVELMPESTGPELGTHLLIEVLLEELVKKCKSKPLLLLFDEIQQLGTSKKYDALTAALRTALDTRKQTVNCIFTGSSRLGLQKMFSDSKAPFFGSASSIPFVPLDIEFVKFTVAVAEKMTKVKIDPVKAMKAFKALGYSPFYFRNVVTRVILHGVSLEEAYRTALEEIAEEEGFKGRWHALSELDRQVFMVVLTGGKLYVQQTLGELTRKTGNTVSASHVQRSITRMQGAEIIGTNANSAYAIESSQFAEWVMRNVK